jgi:hypothetical protein
MVPGEDPLIIVTEQAAVTIAVINPTKSTNTTVVEAVEMSNSLFDHIGAQSDDVVGISITTWNNNVFQSNETGISNKVVTVVLTLEGSEVAVENLDEPLYITIPYTNDWSPETIVNTVCLYWTYDNDSWSQHGCTFHSYTDAGIVCACNHLSDFTTRSTFAAPTTSTGGDGGEPKPKDDNSTLIMAIVIPTVVVIIVVVVLGAAVGIRRQRQKAEASQVKPVDLVGELSPRPPEKEKAPEPPKVEPDRNSAATKIQATYRGYSTRKELERKKEEDKKPIQPRSEPFLPPIPPSPSVRESKDELPPIKPEKAPEKPEKPEKSLKPKKPKKTTKGKKATEKAPAKKPKQKPTPPPSTAVETPEAEVVESPALPDYMTKVYGEREHRAAIKIQRSFRRFLASQVIQREEEIEQLLLDIDELLSSDL